MSSPTPTLMGIPYELRERILQPLVMQMGVLETQTPLWGEKTDFVLPIMQVCRLLRIEALETFYRVNRFKYILDVQNHQLTDPTNCLAVEASEHGIVDSEPLPSAIPWKYPGLMENMRHVTLQIYVPRIGEFHDRASFSGKLSKLIKALGYGQRLKDLLLVLGTHDFVSPLSESEHRSLAILGEIRLPGSLRLKVHPQAFKNTVAALGLEAKIQHSN